MRKHIGLGGGIQFHDAVAEQEFAHLRQGQFLHGHRGEQVAAYTGRVFAAVYQQYVPVPLRVGDAEAFHQRLGKRAIVQGYDSKYGGLDRFFQNPFPNKLLLKPG